MWRRFLTSIRMNSSLPFPVRHRVPGPVCLSIGLFMATLIPLKAALWEGANEVQGWLHLDWFGYWYPVGANHLHAEHGWQYALGDSNESIYLYDYALNSWTWTSASTYPWIYRFADPSEWAWYYRGAQPGNRWYYLPDLETFLPEWDWRLANFRTGEQVTHTVAQPTGSPTVIVDTTTGLRLEVPAGEHGTVKVAPLLEAPPAPFDGEGYHIETDDMHDLVLEIPAEELAGDVFPMLFVYGQMEGIFDDEIGYSPRWTPVPYDEEPDGSYRFYLPFTAPAAPDLSRQNVLVPSAATPGRRPKSFWLSRIDSSMPERQQHYNIRQQVGSYVDFLLADLSSAAHAKVESFRSTHPLRISYGSNSYQGFNVVRLGSWGRSVRPLLAISSPLITRSLAHETGHYMTHMLVGHDTYDVLQTRGGCIRANCHGIQVDIGRDNLVEDYAYFIEWYLTGVGGNMVLEHPYNFFRATEQIRPTNIDIPSLEGFAAHMLAGLRSEATTMYNHERIFKEVAPIGLSWSRIFDIISAGALTVEDLRDSCEAALSGDAREAFLIYLNRIGWSYRVKGRLVDDTGAPIEGALVRTIKRIGDTVYAGSSTRVPSKADGSFFQTGDVYGGASMLEVTLETGVVMEVPIEIKWSEPTNEQVDLGTLEVAETSALNAVFAGTHTSGQAFPPGFQIDLSCNLAINILGGDPDAARVEIEEDFDYNTPVVRIHIFAPVGSEVEIKGPMQVVPSPMGGSYDTGVQEDPVYWEVTNISGEAYGGLHPHLFASESGNTAQLDGTIGVNDGLSAQAMFSRGGDFYTTGEMRTYLGRYAGSFLLMVYGEAP